MAVKIHEMTKLEAWVDDVVFMPGLQAPEDAPHCFVYFIAIENLGDEPVTILGRKWILKEDQGRVQVIEGEGVVGESPRLLPGEKFSYSSYHTVSTDTLVSGTYFGMTDSGAPIYCRLKDFTLQVPV